MLHDCISITVGVALWVLISWIEWSPGRFEAIVLVEIDSSSCAPSRHLQLIGLFHRARIMQQNADDPAWTADVTLQGHHTFGASKLCTVGDYMGHHGCEDHCRIVWFLY